MYAQHAKASGTSCIPSPAAGSIWEGPLLPEFLSNNAPPRRPLTPQGCWLWPRLAGQALPPSRRLPVWGSAAPHLLPCSGGLGKGVGRGVPGSPELHQHIEFSL